MKNRRRYFGQSLIEFALILPVLLLLITGFLDLGRAVFYYSSLTNAVREATRYAIVNHDALVEAHADNNNNSLQDKVLEYAFGLTVVPNPLLKEDIEVYPDRDDSDRYFTTVLIRATYTYIPITPGITLLFGAGEGIDLVVQSQMVVTPGSR